MARIRTIKPEICTSSQFVECSANARLLFVLMLCFFDDGGNHPASVKRLKMEIFPADDFRLSEIQSFMDELICQGLVVEYELNGDIFWHVTGWSKHQKIDKPNPKFPEFDERLVTVRRTNVEQYPAEGKGREVDVEGKGMEKEESTPPPTPSMTLFEIRKRFREMTGVELGGGVNESLSSFCKTYAPDCIEFALLATSTLSPKPKNPFLYFKSVLEGKGANKDFNPSSTLAWGMES